MKNILTFLMSFIVALATAQTNNPKSLTEFAASGGTVQQVNTPGSQNLKSANVSAAAGITYYSSRAAFDSDFPGLPVEDFENGNIFTNGAIGFEAPLNTSTNNSYFGTGDILPGIEFTTTNPNNTGALALIGTGFAGNTSKLVVANYFVENFIINFNPAVKTVGMDIVNVLGGSQATVEIYDANSNLLASTSASCSPAGVFWGVTSDTPIGQIIINTASSGAEGADNIAFASAPVVVPVSSWAIYLVFFLIVASTVLRFRKSIFKKA